MGKNMTLYEVLMGKGRSAEGSTARPAGAPPAKARRAAPSGPGQSAARRGSRFAPSFGERTFTVTCTWNGVLICAVVAVVLLAGMFGLGHATAGGAQAAVIPEGRIPAQGETPGAPKAAPASTAGELRTEQALGVAFYADKERTKEFAGMMARYLQEKGFKGTVVVPNEAPKGVIVAVPIGEGTESELRARIRKLPPPPFDRNFDFQKREENFLKITLAGV